MIEHQQSDPKEFCDKSESGLDNFNTFSQRYVCTSTHVLSALLVFHKRGGWDNTFYKATLPIKQKEKSLIPPNLDKIIC